MQQYILNDKTKEFSPSDINHIVNVMRMKTDDLVSVCFSNKCYEARLKIKGQVVSYEVIKEIEKAEALNVTLIQGNLKGTKLETTIKYATIFGASNIIIVDFVRSIAKLKNVDHKLNRFIQISKEAAELSKRMKVPTISFNSSLKEINYNEYDLVILADEDEKKVKLEDLKDYHNKKIAIIIGPEGGIDPKERKMLGELGVVSVSLGNFIFPAEIAAVNLLSRLII